MGWNTEWASNSWVLQTIVSSSRIIIAMTLGAIIFHDQITYQILFGAALILAAQYGVIGSQMAAVRSWAKRVRG